jgi:hypothetical protein
MGDAQRGAVGTVVGNVLLQALAMLMALVALCIGVMSAWLISSNTPNVAAGAGTNTAAIDYLERFSTAAKSTLAAHAFVPNSISLTIFSAVWALSLLSPMAVLYFTGSKHRDSPLSLVAGVVALGANLFMAILNVNHVAAGHDGSWIMFVVHLILALMGVVATVAYTERLDRNASG